MLNMDSHKEELQDRSDTPSGQHWDRSLPDNLISNICCFGEGASQDLILAVSNQPNSFIGSLISPRSQLRSTRPKKRRYLLT